MKVALCAGQAIKDFLWLGFIFLWMNINKFNFLLLFSFIDLFLS